MEVDRLIINKGPLAGQEIELSDVPLIFGRSEKADIVIDERSISLEHARIMLTGTDYQIEDLDSHNGTFLNEDRLSDPQTLSNGDRIRLGLEVVLLVELLPKEPPQTVIGIKDEQVEAQSIHPKDGELKETQIGVSVTSQPAKLQISTLDKPQVETNLTDDEISIGRHDSNDIVIDAKIVSRQHFQLIRQGNDFLFLALPKVVNPVYVNDELAKDRQLLQDGDRLTIGLSNEEFFVSIIYTAAKRVESLTGEADINATISRKQTSISTPVFEEDKTMVEEGMVTPPTLPPQLVITTFRQDPILYTLKEDHISIGRHTDNDIVLEGRFVSRHHATIERRGPDYFIVPSPSVGNPLVINGNPVMEATRLEDGAKLRIHGVDPSEMISFAYLSPEDETRKASKKSIQFTESKLVSIGRDVENDLVLDSPMISRFHAQVERIGQRYRVRDLKSSNGTFVNRVAITEDTWLQTGDTIHVGPYRLEVGHESLSHLDESEGGMRIEAFGLKKWVRKDLNILQDISLVVQPGEFTVVVGQSGGGKSTLVDAMAGYRPATHGRVIVNDTIDIYKDFESIRNSIGFVPQKDIIHMQLTVFQALDYAAQLRMSADMTQEERGLRIDEVLEELDLSHRRDTQISELSGGQQKRVSIGVELLTKPGLFFLDEPTSGLDPGMETDLMQLMRRLADQGRTIVLITHATKNVMLADRVAFLARGGFLVWFGPPDEALNYFDQYRSKREHRTKPIEFDDIYKLLDKDENGSPEEWADRFRKHEAYEKYISQQLKKDKPTPLPDEPKVSRGKKGAQRVSALRQFLILSARNLQILIRDRATLGLMLLSAPILAGLDFILAFGVGRNPFAFDGGDFNDIIVTLIVLTNTSVLVGGLTMMRELVREREIYKRERMVNLKLFPYITSKLLFAIVLAVYQSFFFTLVRHVAFDMPGGNIEIFYFFVTIFLMVMAGMMMGLLTSALAPNSNSAPLLLVLFVLPQMVLSGALVPLPDFASAVASSRWTFQSVIGISGAGSEVIGDACWTDLNEEEQDALTLEEKEEQCTCMGVNALRQESCNFPGIGQFYVDAIDQDAPLEPSEPSDEPESPEYPDAPIAPEDLIDPLALQTFFEDLEIYNEEVEVISEDFDREMTNYRDEQTAYADAFEVYLDEFTEYETDRATAVGSAESTIRRFYEDYGWTFLDNSDASEFLKALLKTWGAQLIIITFLFTLTVIVQKRRDVN